MTINTYSPTGRRLNRRPMSRKIQKRIKQVSQDLEDALLNNAIQLTTQNKSDDSLFMIDRKGSKSIRKRVVQEVLPKSQGVYISATEKRLIQKVLTSKPKQPYARLYSTSENKALKDLWDADVIEHNDSDDVNYPTTKRRRLKVAVPGQSYNPSIEDHQNALAEAVALQLKKEDSTIEPKSTSLVPFHKSIISIDASTAHGGADHDDSDDDSMDSTNNSSTAITERKKLQTKYTRAQRNRIKARSIAKASMSIELLNSNILQSIDNLPSILKEINQKEQYLELRKTIIPEPEIDSITLNLGYEDVGTVPLTDEIGGGLREVIPKGTSLVDRAVTMRRTGDLNVQNKRARRAYEKPHAAKRVVWVAKYKYV